MNKDKIIVTEDSIKEMDRLLDLYDLYVEKSKEQNKEIKSFSDFRKLVEKEENK